MTQSTVWLSSDFTLLFCVCSPLKQPHNILQKRLMETNLSKFRGSRGSWAPKDLSSQTNKLNQTRLGSSGKTEDEELIVVSCQVIVSPQPFVGFFAADFIPHSLRLCSCSPCFPVRFVLPQDCHSWAYTPSAAPGCCGRGAHLEITDKTGVMGVFPCTSGQRDG